MFLPLPAFDIPFPVSHITRPSKKLPSSTCEGVCLTKEGKAVSRAAAASVPVFMRRISYRPASLLGLTTNRGTWNAWSVTSLPSQVLVLATHEKGPFCRDPFPFHGIVLVCKFGTGCCLSLSSLFSVLYRSVLSSLLKHHHLAIGERVYWPSPLHHQVGL